MLYIALAAAAGLIGLDQLTKILIDSNMQLHQSIPIISFGDTNVLNITYERNPGAALRENSCFLYCLRLWLSLLCCI